MRHIVLSLIVIGVFVCVAGVDACGPEGTTLLGAYNVHGNHLGSVELITDDSPLGVARRSFLDPYGRQAHEVSSVSASFPTYGFTDHELDRESGLYYARFRYYDPVIGRFVSPDPALNEGGVSFQRLATQPQALNAYSYVENQPTVSIDPDGRSKRRWVEFSSALRAMMGKSTRQLHAFRLGVARRSLVENGFAFIKHKEHRLMGHAGALRDLAHSAAEQAVRRGFQDDPRHFGIMGLGIADRELMWAVGDIPLTLPDEIHGALRAWVDEVGTVVRRAYPDKEASLSFVSMTMDWSEPRPHVDSGLMASIAIQGQGVRLFPRAQQALPRGTFPGGPRAVAGHGMTAIWHGLESAEQLGGAFPMIHRGPNEAGTRLVFQAYFEFGTDLSN